MSTFDSALAKRISFILATKNRVPYLEQALLSARDLKKPEDELIVVDGLSQDNTLEVLQRHADLVDLVVSEKDASEADAFNKGILLSRGKYIKLLSDDDTIYPAAMEQAVAMMEAHPEIDILLCGGTKQRGERLRTVYLPPGANYGKRVEDALKYKGCGIGLVIRRSALSRVGLLNARAVALDKDFLAQCISRSANVKFCRIHLYHHRIENHSAMVRRETELEKDFFRIAKQYCSPGFYLRYRFGKMLSRYWLYRYVAWRLSLAPGIMRRIAQVLRRQPQPARGPQEPVWDGGFS